MNPNLPEAEMGHGDPDPDDVDAALEDLDPDKLAGVDEVQSQIDTINAISDPAERKAAAKAWTVELEG